MRTLDLQFSQNETFGFHLKVFHYSFFNYLTLLHMHSGSQWGKKVKKNFQNIFLITFIQVFLWNYHLQYKKPPSILLGKNVKILAKRLKYLTHLILNGLQCTVLCRKTFLQQARRLDIVVHISCSVRNIIYYYTCN